jgi:hypothetical protein
VLLEAYLSEFTADDAVELHILTKPFDKGSGVSGWGRPRGGLGVERGGRGGEGRGGEGVVELVGRAS